MTLRELGRQFPDVTPQAPLQRVCSQSLSCSLCHRLCLPPGWALPVLSSHCQEVLPSYGNSEAWQASVVLRTKP